MKACSQKCCVVQGSFVQVVQKRLHLSRYPTALATRRHVYAAAAQSATAPQSFGHE